jgi:hypothetical protein
MTQATDNLALAVNGLAAEIPAVVAALQATGTPDAVIQQFADQINSITAQIVAALPPAPPPAPPTP